VEARSGEDLHRAAPRERELEQILSIQKKRVVRQDGTIRHGTKLCQILNLEQGIRLKEVMVQERMDGQVYLVHEGKDLKYQELKEPLKKQVSERIQSPVQAKRVIPGLDHPWKRARFRKIQYSKSESLAA
jgi:hypothetical protein